jgi:HD-GYP domain-containing protein (c-di-GMP phosphodiesterase class II)
VFDALTQQRPYKPAWPVADAVAEIERQRGGQFDPGVVDAFLRVIEGQHLQNAPIGLTGPDIVAS